MWRKFKSQIDNIDVKGKRNMAPKLWDKSKKQIRHPHESRIKHEDLLSYKNLGEKLRKTSDIYHTKIVTSIGRKNYLFHL